MSVTSDTLKGDNSRRLGMFRNVLEPNSRDGRCHCSIQSKLLYDHADLRTFALVFETGDELMSLLSAFAEEKQLLAAQISAIGAFSDAELKYFDWDSKAYLSEGTSPALAR